MSGELNLAEQLAARLCHDLSGLVGSLMGALDLAREDPAMAEEALPMAHDASAALTGRLRLMRAAWAAGAGGMDPETLAQAIAPLRTARIRFDLAGIAALAPFEAGLTRVLLNALMLAAEALRKGGVATLRGGAAGGLELSLAGPGVAWPDGFAALLGDPGETPSMSEVATAARQVQARMLVLVAREAGVGLSLAAGDGVPVLLMRG